jgi:membrane protease YdiL (CAAX protease family)
VLTPGIVALALTYRAQGAAGVRDCRSTRSGDVGARWYAFALLFMFSVKLLVAVVVRITTGMWPVFGSESLPLMFAAAIGSTLVGGQVGEELGWRGYALPGLARRLGLPRASLLLGVVWATWHLPLFFILGGDTVGQSFPFYLLQVTAISVAIAWLFMKTRGSLLLTMLLHAAVNNTKDIVPSAVPGASNPWLLHATTVGWLTWPALGLRGILSHRQGSDGGETQRGG